ncbi:MAG: hypothetical protein R3A79_02585 [Nannocystaceae bacterium]
MHSPIDLSRYIQRRHFRAYERDMARSTYGYGVDLRRTRWLTTSLAGQTPLRALEHAWFAIADELMGGELRFPTSSGDIPILSEIVDIAKLLHTTPPAIRILTPQARGWGVVTPLGDPRGSDEWLVLDLEALERLPPAERAFLLGMGLGHLHCGHGALFLAHLLAVRRRGGRVLRTLLRPWVRVAAFSGDRAGLLAAGDLQAATRALQTSVATSPKWAPRFPPLEVRALALEEFAETTVAARFRARKRREGHEITLEEDLQALAGPPQTPDEADASGEAAPPPRDATPPDSEVGVPDDAWTLARCDHRLTTRLGLF